MNTTAFSYETTTNDKPLRDRVKTALQGYFNQLAGHDPAGLYTMVLEEMEVPMLETLMRYCKGNQCRASRILGISRTTLRKKLKKYALEDVG